MDRRNPLQDAFFTRLFHGVSDAIYVIDPDSSSILAANEAGCRALGMSAEELIDQSVLSLNQDVTGPNQWREISAAIIAAGNYTFMGRHVRKDGTDFPVEVVTDYLEYQGRGYLVSVARDLSEHHRHREHLTDDELIRALLLNESSDGLWDWNLQDHSLFLSPQWFRMLGYGPNEISSPTLDTWRNSVHPDDLDRVIALLQDHLQGNTSRYEAKYRLRSRDGHYLWVHDRGMVAQHDLDGRPQRMIGLVLDITESEHYAAELLERSQRDELTGLYNRRTGYELFERFLRDCRRDNQPLQVVMLDIDHFKPLNDSYGHLEGDSAIRHVADELRRCLRADEWLFRWGGEEFLLLFPGTDRRAAQGMMQRLLQHFNATPFVTRGGESRALTFSAGISGYPEDGNSIRQLVGAADRAMYRAKSSGRNRVEG
ncbi:diguanylate cyclase [Marinobacterium sp. MBR-109]|jgi:diguanylate cyclase (GGDEF)-like protein/PAS domain S-box-containing protein|uniref:sensor domain-containing diguanylate cyclase n=1 Tax=Marinobacterium sp. MBR-109 TaxID=3156462 RepID=UPI00339A8BDC